MQINGVNYHVEVEGSGPPLVLLHGFTGSSENWRHIRPALHEHFTTITIDLLGHGQTDTPEDPNRYAMEFAAQDLAAGFAELNFPHVHLLGYSMGGRLALYFAARYPDLIAKLVLEGASPGLAAADERAARIESDERLARMIESESIEVFADYWTNQPLFATQNDDLRQRLRQQRLQNNALGLANSLRGMGTGVQPSRWDKLKQLTCPTLLIAGEHDAKFVRVVRQMEREMPSAQVAVIPNAGHTTHAEEPEAYIQAVLRFLLDYN